ncbi:neuferricin homolog isoform X2 [Aricia agestis]|uniref:neuferricin homolog isoform X2 n=1 Tax=Aricia agestis TaxID=91739 RepID=UPI001C20991C|nr:neuferricin homolog isoform X2 [Aricia agestis]
MESQFLKFNTKIFLSTVTFVALAIFIQNYFSDKVKVVKLNKSQKNVYDSSELLNYNGKDLDQLYLAVLGSIFDVTAGKRHYGEGESYHYFVGKDGSRALITGNFRDESADKDHVLDLTCDNILNLLKWRRTFREKYIYIGVLNGRYYNENGEETKYMAILKERISECRKAKEEEKRQEKLFPPCNMAWSKDEGTRVWCTGSSGGVLRNWEGVPRQLYTPGEAKPTCVCVSEDKLNNSLLKEYENCPETSKQCIVKS